MSSGIKRRRRQRKGYVLVMTLLIIAMVAILTVGLARFSMNKAVDSIAAESDLQTRWGTTSCQRFALANARKILNPQVWDDESEEWSSEPVRSSNVSIRLTDQVFQVVLADESAKLDLNFVAEFASQEKTKELVRKFAKAENVTIRLRPLSKQKQRGPTEHQFGCWGQVFESDVQPDIFPGDILIATEDLTCWSQKLNYRNASDEVLFETCKLAAGASIARRVVQERGSNEQTGLDDMMSSIGASERQKQALRVALAEQSRAQSIWVRAVANGQPRYSLIVRERFTSSLSRIYSFAW